MKELPQNLDSEKKLMKRKRKITTKYTEGKIGIQPVKEWNYFAQTSMFNMDLRMLAEII